MKSSIARCSSLVLSLMATVAVVFANCQCLGRVYEPKDFCLA